MLLVLLRDAWLCERPHASSGRGDESGRGSGKREVADIRRASDATQLENGAFAEYIVAKGDLQIKIPHNLSDEEAATLGISICTVVRIMSPCPFPVMTTLLTP